MNPEVILISRVEVDWPTLRKNISVVLNRSPSDFIAQSPVKFTPAAEYLIFAAYLKYEFKNKDPLQILRTLPHEILNFLHYSFLVACDKETYENIRDYTGIIWCPIKVYDNYCILGTGSLFDWWYYITLHLSQSINYSREYRIFLDKVLLLLEKEGLRELFNDYSKKALPDKTFLLEQK